MKSIIIFDFNRTLYDPESGEFIQGSDNVIREFHKRGHKLFLVSKDEGPRKERMESVGLDKYFESMHFVEEKSEGLFKMILREANVVPANCYVIGDYIKSEIVIGNTLGMNTIRYRRGKFSEMEAQSEMEEADKEISNLEELLGLISD